eukprot:TRINITY_DN25217_c1_g1_i1.p1 TRINITY_DN25217_c1_g1~~TRINITY_DN25217_c1_g1_i1.p1  ORF type:complete len:417 (+),score=137.38 TRINITY_DN25217_c1_g1_i1:40-1290(+)
MEITPIEAGEGSRSENTGEVNATEAPALGKRYLRFLAVARRSDQKIVASFIYRKKKYFKWYHRAVEQVLCTSDWDDYLKVGHFLSLQNDLHKFHFALDGDGRLYVVISTRKFPDKDGYAVLKAVQERFVKEFGERSLTCEEEELSTDAKLMFFETCEAHDQLNNTQNTNTTAATIKDTESTTPVDAVVPPSPVAPISAPKPVETVQPSSSTSVTRPRPAHGRPFKVILLGNSNVGKSKMLACVNPSVDSNAPTKSTLSVELMTYETVVDGREVSAVVWDTVGQERYKSVMSSYYRGVQGAVFVYDITVPATLAAVDSWVEELRFHAGDDVVMVLVGNKLDMEAERKVSTDAGVVMAQKHNMRFVETSALTGTNIKDTFETLIRDLVARLSTPEEEEPNLVDLVPSRKPGKSGGCPC